MRHGADSDRLRGHRRPADIGEACRNAVQIAVQDTNSAGGIDGRPIELPVRDLHEAGVAAIVGPNVSVVAAGMLRAVDELDVVTISPTASSLTFADRNDTSDGFLRFRDTYRERFQQEPGNSSIAAHDAFAVLFQALQGDAATQGPALKRALLHLPPVAGLQQPVKFNRFGDAQRRAFFVRVRDGRFVAE